MLNYKLYLDESGEFCDSTVDFNSVPSLVGGILATDVSINDPVFDQIPKYSHASEGYDKSLFFSVLQRLKESKIRFVIFENKERIKVINGDITYLNIMSEGLVKIMQQLANDSAGHAINLDIIIASRNIVSPDSNGYQAGHVNIISEADYKTRLEEKLILALGKSKLDTVNYNLSFTSARKSKYLKAADIVCNTYYTKNKKTKFDQNDREQIEALYSEAFIFPVFDNGTVAYIKKLFEEKRYGEMICQLCFLPKLSGVTVTKKQLLNRLAQLPDKERIIIFSYASLQISQLNYNRMFSEGIAFAENYKKYILEPLAENEKAKNSPELLQDISYQIFDTDFFILTMYDHMGNTPKCNEYLARCHANIGSINRSWEHMDYYFRYKLREMNCLIGQFDFERALAEAAKTVSVLNDAKELFDAIGMYDGTGNTPSSELLGKTHGIRLEAYINLIKKKPKYLKEAIEASDASIKEFTESSDVRRQLQYRCQLMAEVGDSDEAVKQLLRSYEIDSIKKSSFSRFLEKAHGEGAAKPDSFSIMHYSNVMISAMLNKSGIAADMATALFEDQQIMKIIESRSYSGHPWQIILWNIGKYYRMTGHKEKYEQYYKLALEIAAEDPSKATMYSFAVCMSADNLLYVREQIPRKQTHAEAEFEKLLAKFYKADLPQSLRSWFQPPSVPAKNHELQELAINYLK